MYNFRYHLVTICSVFIALALGLLLGAAIASSEVVQSTSDDMVDSMMSRYETLVNENVQLEQSLDSNSSLAEDLTAAWSKDRLDGRTIALMLGNSVEDRSLRSSLTELINNAGGSVVSITIIDPDFGLGDDATSERLRGVVAEVAGEEYQQTLAKKLAEEWTFVYVASSIEPTQEDYDLASHNYIQEQIESNGTSALADSHIETIVSSHGPTPQTAFQSMIHEQYPLTRTLLALGIISISADYSQLSQHADPAAPNDQLAAYAVTSAWQLPYNVNGFINGFVPDRAEVTEQNRVGIQMTLRIQEAGAAGDIHYPAWLRASLPKSSSGDVALPNYYALLIQPSDSDTSMEAIASANNLSCVTSPNSTLGRYSVLALLTGSQAGIYGENRDDENRYAPLPQDESGRAAFR